MKRVKYPRGSKPVSQPNPMYWEDYSFQYYLHMPGAEIVAEVTRIALGYYSAVVKRYGSEARQCFHSLQEARQFCEGTIATRLSMTLSSPATIRPVFG
jgi:hypothetical protein